MRFYRRYRVFVVVAVFTVFALYRFTTIQEWEAATASGVATFKSYAGHSYKSDEKTPAKTKLSPADAKEAWADLAAKVEAALPPPVAKPVNEWELGKKSSTTAGAQTTKTIATPIEEPTPSPKPGKYFGLSGQGRVEAPPPLDKNTPVIHWERLPEHFPIPESEIIALPTSAPKAITKLQYTFKAESAAEKSDREKKLAEIKAAFQHSWKGYQEHAWLNDELRPISGESRDPFCGWGATLVDALDTLWIMGLEKEFDEAIKALEDVDFTTTTRTDIPLFETTIRYLGGLLAAHDVSEGKHNVTLAKAQELGDVLLSAFDTPNRMPIMYYNWRPTFAKNPHRAGTRTVLAELGSLSMEFTRLAQLTGENKYYDAVARITNELQLMQSTTRVPGLWPSKIDTSGCQKASSSSPENSGRRQVHLDNDRNFRRGTEDDIAVALLTRSKQLAEIQKRQLFHDDAKAAEVSKSEKDGSKENPKKPVNEDDSPAEYDNAKKAASPASKTDSAGTTKAKDAKADTKVQAAESTKTKDTVPAIKTFLAVSKSPKDEPASGPLVADKAGIIPPDESLGDDEMWVEVEMDDEEASKLPKDKVKSKVSDEPIIKDKVDCQPQGLASPPHSYSEDFSFGGGTDSTYEYLPKMHLLLGGQVSQYGEMYGKAMDAANKHLLFRPMIPEEQREILVVGSAEIREGWPEYPEGNFTFKPTQSHLLCFTGGMYAIGAKIFGREQDFDIAKKITDGCVWSYESMASGIMAESNELVACPSRTDCPWNETLWQDTVDPYWSIREANRLRAQEEMSYESDTHKGLDSNPIEKRQSDEDLATTEASTESAEEAAMHNTYPTHAEYVKQLVEARRLPKGVPSINNNKYQLRPEAIESVFIMYRMTGDNYWREKGWKMWQAITRETKAKFGHSTIRDVTRTGYSSNQSDEMESFWLAETLKYFYLLFSPPETISLDKWVFNTEAHPFLRPA